MKITGKVKKCDKFNMKCISYTNSVYDLLSEIIINEYILYNM